MDRINNNSQVNQIAELIRSRVQRTSPAQSKPVVRSDRDDPHQNRQSSGKPLKELIVARLKTLNADDDDFQLKAGKIFLSTVISEELGSSVVDDPDFDEMSSEIYKTIATHPDLSAPFQQLLIDLYKS